MEDGLVVKGRGCGVRIWRIIALVLLILLILMTSLLIWQVVESKQRSDAENHGTSDLGKAGSILTSPCPRIPPLLPLPNPLPQAITDRLNRMEIQLGLLVNKELSLPAISANIFYQDRVIWSGHFGSKKTGDPAAKPDGNTRYRIASVSKIFPVLMAYKLYEEGLIGSLDDPLSKYAPEFDIKNIFTRDNITIREMASQMSGLPREAPCIYHCSDTNTSEQIHLLQARSLVKAPWSQPTYSNLAYALIGRVLSERVLNQTYESWVINNILKPLGMENTGFNLTAAVEENMAFPYDLHGNLMPFLKTGWIAPAAEMYSTMNDLTKLGMMLARPDKQSLFQPASLREMLLPLNIAPDGKTLWGAPWEILFIHGFPIRGKAGNIDSYNTFVSVIPELQIGMNMLVSAAPITGSNSIAVLVTESIYKTLIPVFNNTMFELSTKASFPISAKPYLGMFELNYTNPILNQLQSFTVSISSRNEILIVAALGSPYGPQRIAEIRYLGDSVLFQFRLGISETSSCMQERGGIYTDMYFQEPNKEGLCPGFSVPGYSMTAVRLGKNARISRVLNRAGVPDFSWLQQVY